MSACEQCWTEASRRAQIKGGVAADYYGAVLQENEGNPDHA